MLSNLKLHVMLELETTKFLTKSRQNLCQQMGEIRDKTCGLRSLSDKHIALHLFCCADSKIISKLEIVEHTNSNNPFLKGLIRLFG